MTLAQLLERKRDEITDALSDRGYHGHMKQAALQSWRAYHALVWPVVEACAKNSEDFGAIDNALDELREALSRLEGSLDDK
jgi:hypothetical protein